MTLFDRLIVATGCLAGFFMFIFFYALIMRSVADLIPIQWLDNMVRVLGAVK